MRLVYDPWTPAVPQRDSWSCLAKSLGWATAAYGLVLPRGTMENRVRDYNIVSAGGYLTDKTGHDIADFMTEHFHTKGLTAEYTPVVSFDEVALDAGRYPMVIGGTDFHHYVAVRGFDPRYDCLYLANSAEGWNGVRFWMTRQQFQYFSPLARIRVTTPWMIAEGEQHRGPIGLCGPYQAVTVGGATLLIPRTDRGAAREGVVDPRLRPTAARYRRGRRILHHELGAA
jgi:hypothetical protein